MDERVLQTQQWLNTTYANNAAYTTIVEDGETGNATFTALIKALQIELGNITVDGSFGDATMARLAAVHPTFSQVADVETAEENNYHYIIQGSLWCKGYNPGGFTGIFGPQTAAAIKSFQSDAGLTQDGVVRPYLLQGIMNTDGYVLAKGGNINYRQAQRILNQNYATQINLIPTNGLWDRKAQTGLIKACQIEWSATPVDGNFGNGTYNKAPTLSQNTSGYTASKRLLQIALTVNGYYPGAMNGVFDTATYQAVYDFQAFACIGADGIAGKNTWASLLKSNGYSGRSATACDTATRLNTTTATALKNAGYTTVGRYLTNAPGTDVLDKKMTDDEISALSSVGMKVFPIYQTAGSDILYFTQAQGTGDASAARNAAYMLGFPYGTYIYFAVDYDVRNTQIGAIVKYFSAIYNNIGEYKVGVYGPRSVCQELYDRGLALRCFISDMSTGFEGNIGHKIPDGWAYDQFATTTAGGVSIDKCVASPRATAVLASELTPRELQDPDIEVDPNYPPARPNAIREDNFSVNPSVYINQGAAIPVYAQKLDGPPRDENDIIIDEYMSYDTHAGGTIIGYIQPNEFYTRYNVGIRQAILDPITNEVIDHEWVFNYWKDYVSLVLIRADDGVVRFGYIQQYEENRNQSNQMQPILPNQSLFKYYRYDTVDKALVAHPANDGNVSRTFDVQRTLKCYGTNGMYLRTLQPGDRILLNSTSTGFGGLSMPWTMWFDQVLLDGESSWENINPDPLVTVDAGGYVELGYQYGTIGAARAIY